ncbi:MAG: S8 family serine peptidase, partial [Patescibacteria group bacterium]
MKARKTLVIIALFVVSAGLTGGQTLAPSLLVPNDVASQNTGLKSISGILGQIQLILNDVGKRTLVASLAETFDSLRGALDQLNVLLHRLITPQQQSTQPSYVEGGAAKGGVIGTAEDYILVKFKSDVGAAKRQEVMSRHGLTEKSEIKQIGVKLLAISKEDTPEEVVDRLKAKEKGDIEFAEVDAIVAPDLIPNDPWYTNWEWHLPKISAPAAWDITTGTSTVIVAIGDTGVDCAHEDLAGKCLPGWNFYDNNSDTSDVYGHGTRVAGTAVANTNNAVGIAAICWNCKILPLRVSGTDGYAAYSALASAITYAADQGAKVINESYMVSESATVQSAARYMQSKGGVVTISAGNYSTFVTTPDVPEI